MNGVDVVDFNRDVRVDVGLDVELGDAQLHFGLVRAEKENPFESFAAVETDDVLVERSALVEPFGQDVRLYSSDGHRSNKMASPLRASPTFPALLSWSTLELIGEVTEGS